MPTVKQLIAQKKNKKEPMLSMMEGMLDRVLEEDINSIIEDAKEDIARAVEKAYEDISDTIRKVQGQFKNSTQKDIDIVFAQFERKADLLLNSTHAQMERAHETLKMLKGEKGDPGYTPKKGKDYFDGEKGENGKPGKNGSPDTPEQTVDKVNKASNLITLSKIAGLLEELNTIKQTVRERRGGGGGGGGMGEPQHQTFTGDGSTTQFTLTYNVAANGNAAWIYYNGQFLVKTTHWTISGKTISLTFTPEDAQSLDVTYIRK